MMTARAIADEEYRQNVLERTRQLRSQRFEEKQKFRESQKLLKFRLIEVVHLLSFT